MPAPYRTAACALTLLGACDAPDVRRVAIVAHYVPGCAPDEATRPRQLELIALGDFDRSNQSVSILESNAEQESLTLPAVTRAADLSSLPDRGYWGSGSLDAEREISILLWPKNQICELSLDAAAPASSASDAWLWGVSSRLGSALALGSSEGTDRPVAIALNLRDARAEAPPVPPGLSRIPAGASISELGDGFLIAGGTDPVTERATALAWWFDAERREMASEPLELSLARSRHAALSLPSGSTLLIGGESEQGQPLGSVELVSPEGRAAPVVELLTTPRIAPRALLLGRDRILVGGGFVRDSSDGTRRPIASVEFASTDLAEPPAGALTLEPPALDRAFVALEAGAALAVGGCGPVDSEVDCRPCTAGSGCISRAVWWIDPQGTAHALEPLPQELAVAQPALVAGASGAPWLIAEGVLGRFDPWQARFTIAAVMARGAPAPLLSPPRALGPGAFLWLGLADARLNVFGLYHSQRNRFTQDVAPLLAGSTEGLVPHLPPEAQRDGEVRLSHSAVGGLQLAGSAAVASISETDYADLRLELTLLSGPPPLVRLLDRNRDDADVTFGGLECPWPAFEVSAAGGVGLGQRLVLLRSGDEVWLRLGGSAGSEIPPDTGLEPCTAPLPERVSVQLVGTRAGTTALSRVEIRRSLR